MKIAVFPGSFDPITNGHLDLIRRASQLFDQLIIAVANNTSKTALLTIQEKVQAITEATGDLANVQVQVTSGLTVDFMQKVNANYLVRGLRNEQDFAYERDIAWMNQSMRHQVETVFLLAAPDQAYVASSLIKEIAKVGGDITQYVPAAAANLIQQHLKAGK